MLVAVVTGASRGLGKRIAVTLGKSGYHVAVNYTRSKSEAEELVRSMDGHAIALKADVGNLYEVQKMAESIFQEWGRVDLLINNAGITRDGMLMKYREDDWNEVIRVNLTGVYNSVKSFAPLMVQSKREGHIVNISSSSGLRGKAGQAAYSASKAALIGLTKTLARELGGHHIRVNAVLPGYMATEMGREAGNAMRKAREDSMLNRLSDPDEVAGFIMYLVMTHTITGQVFCLDSRI
jgi:3-oxoacyl-[acyl-carrier protein] reductase